MHRGKTTHPPHVLTPLYSPCSPLEVTHDNIQMLTKVELTVEFFTVDNVEPVLDPSIHVRHLKVEPLVMVICVYIWVQY